MFKKTVTSFNTACRALDKLVLDPNIRNSATVEHLSVKLEEGLGKLEVARLRVGEQETAVMIAQERLFVLLVGEQLQAGVPLFPFLGCFLFQTTFVPNFQELEQHSGQ